jgi:RHS repeat-associated protein
MMGWDIEGNMASQSGTTLVYVGLNRAAGSLTNGNWTDYIYAPDGRLFATEDNKGGLIKMFVPLPTAFAVYNGAGLLAYRRYDWQGSVRVASTPSKTLYDDSAYGAFGEPYSAFSADPQFASLTSDISSGNEQVSLSRRYHPTQGRWVSPDKIIPDVYNPQSFNSYAYVLNNPLSNIDATGLDCLYLNDTGDGVENIEQSSNPGECGSNGGYWVDGGFN